MTILQLEPSPLLLRDDPQSYDSSAPQCSETRDGFVLVDWRRDDFLRDGKLRQNLDEEDTLSTTSLSDSSSDCGDRRVSFVADEVTDVFTRPYTPPGDVPDLYYSCEDIARFRQEYRLERRLFSSMDDCDEATSSEDASSDDAPASEARPFSSSSPYCISRVVVLHNDRVETLTGISDSFGAADGAPSSTTSFDNDSFWTGSITWY